MVTTYQRDGAGRVVRAESEGWTLHDLEMVLALEDYEADICAGCGQPLAESTDKANEGRYVSTARVCFGCVEMDIGGRRFEDHDHPSALRLGVTLPPELAT